MSEEVFTAAGRALAQAHRFERNLKGLAALVHSVHTAGEPAAEEVSFSKLSLGPLIDAARRFVRFEPGAEEMLEEARTRRNALCHSFFEDHDEELRTEEGSQRLVAILQTDGALFAHAADLCSNRLKALVTALESELKRV